MSSYNQKVSAEDRKTMHKYAIGGVVLAAVIVLVAVLNSSLMLTRVNAVTVKDTSYSASEFNYYYYNTYYNYYSIATSYMGLDTSKPLNTQEYSEGVTWQDFFRDTALDTLTTTTARYDAAIEAGYELTDEDKKTIEDTMDSLKEAADTNDMTVKKFLVARYGKGFTEDTLRKMLEIETIASSYYNQVMDSKEYTQEELDKAYAEQADSQDRITYSSYLLSAETDSDGNVVDGALDDAEDKLETALADLKPGFVDVTITTDDTADAEDADKSSEDAEDADKEDAEEDDAEKSEDAKAEDTDTKADDAKDTEDAEETDKAVVTSTAIAADDALVEKNTAAVNAALADVAEDAALSENTTAGSSLSSDLSAWLLDANRKSGDITVVRASTGCYVVVFGSRDDNRANTVNARHILINAEADDDGNYTEEAKEKAKEKAEEILKEWEDGDKTEDSFAELATEYSEDTGSSANGGLYENIYPGQMVTEFNDFCFDESRKPGDTGIVFNEGSYCGYHIIYFVGEGEPYRDVLAKSSLNKTAMEEWDTDISKGYDYTTGFGMKFAM